MPWFRIDQQGRRDEQRPAGAIVVLGAAQYDGRPSAVFAARLDHAVALYLAGLAPYLVVTGGKLDGRPHHGGGRGARLRASSAASPPTTS